MFTRKNDLVPTPPRKINAFTLAEVLITLVIIGVIAAITVPTLINKTQNQEYVSRLKKAYSTLSQVTNLIIAEEGTPKSSDASSNDGWANSAENIFNLYKKHLNNAKECSDGIGCHTQGSIRRLDNDELTWNLGNHNKVLVLSDGTQVGFWFIDKTCSNQWTDWYKDAKHCARIIVDLNGSRKPNKWGRDNFIFLITENGLKPGGCSQVDYCVENGGFGCACKVLREGAMNY